MRISNFDNNNKQVNFKADPKILVRGFTKEFKNKVAEVCKSIGDDGDIIVLSEERSVNNKYINYDYFKKGCIVPDAYNISNSSVENGVAPTLEDDVLTALTSLDKLLKSDGRALRLF